MGGAGPNQAVLRTAAAMLLARFAEYERNPPRFVRPQTLDEFRTRYADDFLGFCSLLEIKPKGATGDGTIPFKPTPIQLAYSAARSPRDIVLKPRQVKVTTLELARDVWFFLTKVGVAVRIFCQSSSDNSMITELSERLNVFFKSLRKNAGLVLEFESETRTAWTLATGSSLAIVGAGASEKAAQKKARGETVHRLHATEVAFWEFAGKTLNAALEAIAGPDKGTEVVFESTANGAGGEEQPSMSEASGSEYFYWLCTAARQAKNGYKFHFFPWLMEPEYATALAPGETVTPAQQQDPERRERERQVVARGATPEQLKWYRAKVNAKGSQAETDQEYPSDPDTCFLVSGFTFFDKVKIETLLSKAVDPIEVREIRRPGAAGSVKIWARPEKGKAYVIPVDSSGGEGGDRGAAHVLERGTGRHMATLWGQFKPAELAKEVMRLGEEYGVALIAPERNNHGHAVIAELEREDPITAGENRKRRYPRIFHDHDRKAGWWSGEVSRAQALSELDRAIRDEEWTSPDADTLREMRTFIVNKKGKAEAKPGAHDDLVITAAIGRYILVRVQSVGSVKAPTPHTYDPEAQGGFG